MDTYTNYNEALKEAQRLSEMTGRNVIPQRQECDCNHWAGCERCHSNGIYVELVYDLCGHRLEDDGDNEVCRDHRCAEREARRKVA